MSWIDSGMKPRKKKSSNKQQSCQYCCEIKKKGLQEKPIECRILLLVKMNRVLGSVIVHEIYVKED